MVLHVSPKGNDQWSGKLAEPNAGRTDGPLATIEGARDALRRLRAGAESRPGAEVRIAAATYFLPRPLVLDPEDGGTPDAPVVYRAETTEMPILSGGERLGGFTAGADGLWRLTIPTVASGGWAFAQLFVNGERRPRPRLPADANYLIEGSAWPSAAAKGLGYDRFRFTAGELDSSWHRLGDVEVIAFHNWSVSRLRIASIDDEKRVVTFTGATPAMADWASLKSGNRYIVENVREALGRPGEWYLDLGDGVLTYAPKPGERPENCEFVAPRLEQLLVLRGNVANRAWVSNVTIQGLAFAHTVFVSGPNGYICPQSERELPAAISGLGARDCAILDCQVSKTASWGIELGIGCRDNRIERCTLADLGAGGIRLGSHEIPRDDEVTASRQIVRDCLIAYAGRIHPAGVGILVGQSPNNIVEHNEIHDLYYTGISLGWTYGYGRSLATHNTVASNHVWNIGQGVLSDMGGIYNLGNARGTVIRGNHVHDVVSAVYGGWGIYLDEGSCEVLVEGNLVHDMEASPFHQHYGRDNVIRNNILAFGKSAQVMRSRVEPHCSFIFERNIFYWSHGTFFGDNFGDGNLVFRDNLYWDCLGRPPNFGGSSLKVWRGKGQDVRSVFADPHFVDAARRDFRLQPDSPAASIGFEPIDVSRAGCLTPKPALGSIPDTYPKNRP